MRCPSCLDAKLEVAVREQVEIDYCPRCRGVWLDRGELDKIVARAELSDCADEEVGFDPRDGDHRERRPRPWWAQLLD